MSALPPVVVSGLPNITPIFMRIWLMKITIVRDSCDRGGELAQRLAHQPGLKADVGVAHLALDLGLGDSAATESITMSVDRARAHEHVGDLERLLAVVGLADEQLLRLDPELARVVEVERVLGVDEGATPPGFWHSAMACRVSVVLPQDSGP